MEVKGAGSSSPFLCQGHKKVYQGHAYKMRTQHKARQMLVVPINYNSSIVDLEDFSLRLDILHLSWGRPRYHARGPEHMTSARRPAHTLPRARKHVG